MKKGKNKKSGPCWEGYQIVGMKMKGNRKVPNCVPVKKAKVGVSVNVGSESALGRIEKAGMVRGGGAAVKGLNFKGVF